MSETWKNRIQELLETVKIEQEKKPLRLAVQLGYLFYVRLFVESQQRESLQPYFPFAGFPMEWIRGTEVMEEKQRNWQIQYQIQYCASMVETGHFMDGAKSLDHGLWNQELCKLVDEVCDRCSWDEGMPKEVGRVLEEVIHQIYRLGNSGLFLLPESVCELMVGVAGTEISGAAHVWNPACRTGTLLGTISREHPEWTAEGMEEDRESALLAQMQRFFYGLKQVRIFGKDPLKEQRTDREMYDVILSNPPVGELQANRQEDYEVVTRKAQLQYLQMVMKQLEKKGLAVLLVNEGVLFQYDAEQKVRQKLVENYELKGVISLPSEAFLPYTGAKASLLIFAHAKRSLGEKELVWFAELDKLGYTLDRHQEKTEENEVPKILQDWKEREHLKERWKAELERNPGKNQWENPVPQNWPKERGWFADRATIRKNEYNLTAGRYKPWLEDAAEEETMSLTELLHTLEKTEQETIKEIQELIEMIEHDE